MRFIGDVHGKFEEYRKIAEASPDGISIQVGDFGIGFPNSDYTSINKMKGLGHFFIRGNHDNPEVCKEFSSFDYPMYLNDGDISAPHSELPTILFIGGALSIDQHHRTEGVDWWRDEELSYSEFNEILEKIEKFGKPIDIVVSHDCPEKFCGTMFPHYDGRFPSITRQGLDSVWEICKPKIQIGGHWHTNRKMDIDGTTFIWLGELSYIDIFNEESIGEIMNYS